MLIRRVADAVDDGVFFRQRDLLAERIADPRLFDRVAMELGHAEEVGNQNDLVLFDCVRDVRRFRERESIAVRVQIEVSK
jgi:hypothetical protein